MLTDGKYFEEYLKRLSLNKADREKNNRLFIVIKKLGSNPKFEQRILELREKHSMPEDGYIRDPNDEDRLIGYNFSADIEREADELGKQYKKWRVGIDLRNILSGFLLCNEPLFFDTRAANGMIELNDYSVIIKLVLPVNSTIELKRYIESVYPLIEAHQAKKGYEKHKKRSCSEANIERDNRILRAYNMLKKLPKRERKCSDLINEVEEFVRIKYGYNIDNETLRTIIHK
jgi:hypothetical protein